MSERRGYPVTFVVFIGRVPVTLLRDIAEVSNTQLLGVDRDMVLENRTAARTKFQELAKKAAKTFLLFVQRRQTLTPKTVKELSK